MTTGDSHIDMPNSAQGEFGAAVEQADRAALEAFKWGEGPFAHGWLDRASRFATARALLFSNHDGSHETVVHNLLGYERVVRPKVGFALIFSAALAAKERRVRTSGGIFWEHFGTFANDEVSIPFDGAFMGRKAALEAAAAESIARAQAVRVERGLQPAAPTDRWSIDASRFKVDKKQMDKERRVRQAGGFAAHANYEARVAEVDYSSEQLELLYTELEARGVEHFSPVLTGRLEDARPPLPNFAFDENTWINHPMEVMEAAVEMDELLTPKELMELDVEASELNVFVNNLSAQVRCAELLECLERADTKECEATRPADRGAPLGSRSLHRVAPTPGYIPHTCPTHAQPIRTQCALLTLSHHARSPHPHSAPHVFASLPTLGSRQPCEDRRKD